MYTYNFSRLVASVNVMCHMTDIGLMPRLLGRMVVDPGTHCLQMFSSLRISLNLETSGYYGVILSIYQHNYYCQYNLRR